MILPRPRFSGPIERRDATVLLALAAAAIAFRLPSGFLALLGLPLAAVVVQGLRRGAPFPRRLKALLLWCLGASFVSVLLFQPGALAGTGNAFVVMLAISAVTVAIFTGGRLERAVDRLMDGLYVGLLAVWGLSIFEVVTGIKFAPLLYPGGNTIASIRSHRLYVAALFPNYNDYCVAMALLCTLVVARMLFRPRVHPLAALGRWVVLASCVGLILAMGSRGALVGVVLGPALVALTSVRALHPRVFTPRLVVLSSLLVLGVVAVIVRTPWFADNSTAHRGVILTNILAMQAADPMAALLGWGSAARYAEQAQAAYGRTLMDPHNVLAEIAIWYGIPALLLYLVVWFTVLRRGLVGMRIVPTWRSVGALGITLMMPVLGVVASSTLRYHLFWLWLVASVAYLQVWRQRASAGAGQLEGAPVGVQHELDRARPAVLGDHVLASGGAHPGAQVGVAHQTDDRVGG